MKDDRYKTQKILETVSDLEKAIQDAGSIKEVNYLREACVSFMKKSPEILKVWQDKYQSLKKCPTCGRQR